MRNERNIIKKSYEYNRKEIVCINCGKTGHVYKKCHLPITSYGVICIKIKGFSFKALMDINNKLNNNTIGLNEINMLKSLLKNVDENYLNKNIKYLMIMRRNSLSLIEFMRGKYKLTDIDYLINTLKLMSNEEKRNLLKYDFEYNWNKLWNIKSVNKNYENEFNESKKNYDKLKKGYLTKIYNNKILIKLDKLIKYSSKKYNEPEWGFPKGRRNINELEIDCAKREFEEETNYGSNEYNLFKFNPITELYMGTNKIQYKHKYYIGEILTEREAMINNESNIQKLEIGDIKWLNIEECLEHIRDYNLDKRNMINNLSYILTSFIMTLKKNIENYYNTNNEINEDIELLI